MGELVGGLLKTPVQELSPEQRTPEDLRIAREASGAVGDLGSVEKVSPVAPESTPLVGRVVEGHGVAHGSKRGNLREGEAGPGKSCPKFVAGLGSEKDCADGSG